MVGTYKLLEDVAISDAAFEAEGKNLNELFYACASALFDTLADVETVGESYVKEVILENKDIERLLFEFLEEIIYLKDVDSVVFKECVVNIDDSYKLKAILKGEKINQKRHGLRSDVKAVTMHMFKLEKTSQGYMARIVLDI